MIFIHLILATFLFTDVCLAQTSVASVAERNLCMREGMAGLTAGLVFENLNKDTPFAANQRDLIAMA